MPVELAIISNSYTPYRIALHHRIVRELPQVHLHSLFTHDTSNAPWKSDAPDEINPVPFGPGELSELATKRPLHEWRKGGRIIDYLRQHRISAVVMLGYNDAGRIRVMRYTKRHHIPTFLFGDSNIRGDNISGFKGLLKRLLVTRIVRGCTGIMPCGTLGQAYFEKYGASPDRIFFFPYEPDYKLIQSLSPQQIDAAKSKYALHDARRRIVFSGRLVDLKRPDLLLEAFVSIAPQRPHWDLVMVGGGHLKDQLQAKVPLELAARVIWTGFIDNQPEISAIYRACDLLVLPSSYEPWALVINEAAAAGLAIVSSDVVGAAADLVQANLNGYLFANNDLQSLTEKLLLATELTRIDSLKSGSARMLESWRQKADPVNGLRRALQYVKLLPT